MATIHVIYDPRSRVEMPKPELIKSMGLSVATLAVPEFNDDAERATFVNKLVGMIFDHQDGP